MPVPLVLLQRILCPISLPHSGGFSAPKSYAAIVPPIIRRHTCIQCDVVSNKLTEIVNAKTVVAATMIYSSRAHNVRVSRQPNIASRARVVLSMRKYIYCACAVCYPLLMQRNNDSAAALSSH